MTIQSTTRKVQFLGNGVATSFPFTFKAFTTADFQATKTSTTGVDTALVLNTNFSVALNADQNASPGGTVTYPISGSPLANGEKLTILTAIAQKQNTDITNNGGFYPQVIEDEFDYLTILSQQLQEIADRTLKIPSSDNVAANAFGNAATRANTIVGFDSTGQPYTATPASLGVLTAYGTANTDQVVATAGQTAFTLSANPGTINNLDITLDGVTLLPSTDFTWSGTTVTLLTGALVGQRFAARYMQGLPTTGVSNGSVVDASLAAGSVISGIEKTFERTTAEISAGVVPTNFGYLPGDVRRYGADATGVADSTAAIQAAVNVAGVSGGIVNIGVGQFKVSSQILVSSLYPVHILGTQNGLIYDPTVHGSVIFPSGNIAGSWIKFTAPSPGVRANHGGGIVRGLAFIDITGSGAAVGTRTCTAALELNDFSQSWVENCVFQWVNGSAIKGEFVVQSNIRGNSIRYCGAASQPALYFPSTSPTFPLQSTSIADNKIEVCASAAYLSIGANAIDVKVYANGFEADTAVALSNQEFLTLAGIRCAVFGNSFNRNTGSQITCTGSNNAFTGNVFVGGAFSVTAFTLGGSRNAISGNTFASTRTGYEINCSGRCNSITGNTFYFSGAIKTTADGCVIASNTFDQLTCTTAVLGAGSDWWISDGAGAGTVIQGNSFHNGGGAITTVGAIRIQGTCPMVANNLFNSFAGSGNGAICLRVETPNAIIGGNLELSCTTMMTTSNIGTGELYGNYSASGATAVPLTGSATYDPPSLADGAGTTTTVAVTGAALGDYATASFSLDLQGITVTSWVSAANTVSVRFQNESGGVLDLVSGTLKVRVTKR